MHGNVKDELIAELTRERERILAKYGVRSYEELWEKIETGEVSDVEAHDDIVRLDYIKYVLDKLRSLETN